MRGPLLALSRRQSFAEAGGQDERLGLAPPLCPRRARRRATPCAFSPGRLSAIPCAPRRSTSTASPGRRRSRAPRVGLAGALVLALTAKLGLPAFLCAGLATAALVVATGGLHEDGIADVADGFGGGATRADKLEIMRDSRIGAYGAIALTLSLLIRVAALTAALDGGLWRAAAALILVAALSRAAALTPLALLKPARADGAGAAAGRLDASALAAAWGVSLVIALALGLVALGLTHALVAALAGGARRIGHCPHRSAADRRANRRRRRRRAAMRRDRRVVRASHRPFRHLS